MIGRYATVQKLKGKGRGIIKESEGVVGAAWSSNDDEAFVDDLPEILDDDDDYDYVRSCVRDWKMDREEVRHLTMKSRTLGAFAIRDSDGVKVAVMVFESLNPQAFTKQLIISFLESGEKKRISLLLKGISSSTPNPSEALLAGF